MSPAHLRHLARRFVTSLRGRSPAAGDVAWAHSTLSPAERTLFDQMTETDKAHAIDVARRVEIESAGSGPVPSTPDDRSWMLAAALLHDVGKIDADLGTLGRVAATLLGPLLPASAAHRMSARRGVIGSMGRHLGYADRGASLLGAIGSDPRVRAWAAEHHQPSDEWTVPAEAGRVLRDADDAAS